MKTLIFIFVGEFGYELLNWQGVVRKLRSKLNTDYKIIVCSRRGMNNFYETCDRFIDISEIPTFKNSIADCYRANGLNKNELLNSLTENEKINYDTVIFSDKRNCIEGLRFGRFGKHEIYHRLDVNNNTFVRIQPDLRNKDKISSNIGFDIGDTSYVLVQLATRNIGGKSNKTLNISKIIYSLRDKEDKIVLLGFNTMRNSDSYSEPIPLNKTVSYSVRDFIDQSCLIHYAKKCLFITEGDFRSHIYVPPFMGKNVYAVAHEEVFNLPTAPISFWNKNVYTFGGQIIPIALKDEDVNETMKIKEKLECAGF